MTDARFSTDGGATLVVSGTGLRPASVELVGPRARVVGRLTGRGATWKAILPLKASRWGGAELPLPVGAYELRIDPGEGATVDLKSRTWLADESPAPRTGLASATDVQI